MTELEKFKEQLVQDALKMDDREFIWHLSVLPDTYCLLLISDRRIPARGKKLLKSFDRKAFFKFYESFLYQTQ